jgi:hypothetical protein
VKRTPLKRKPWRRALGTADQRLRFKQAVLEADGYRCVVCGEGRVDHSASGELTYYLEAAHVVRKHTLRKRGYGADVVYSVDAAFTLCRDHHALHDSYALRVPDSLIPERCREFVKRIEADKLYERSTG